MFSKQQNRGKGNQKPCNGGTESWRRPGISEIIHRGKQSDFDRLHETFSSFRIVVLGKMKENDPEFEQSSESDYSQNNFIPGYGLVRKYRTLALTTTPPLFEFLNILRDTSFNPIWTLQSGLHVQYLAVVIIGCVGCVVLQSCQSLTYFLPKAFLKVLNDLLTFHGEDKVLLWVFVAASLRRKM